MQEGLSLQNLCLLRVIDTKANEEIYTIFDTKKILGKPATVQISKTSGLAGIAYWINGTYRLEGDKALDKRDPLVLAMKGWIDSLYEEGRQTAMTDKELEMKIEELAPGRFIMP